MTNQHPIIPPPDLVNQWASESLATQHLCNQAAQWGANQELEACLERILDVALANRLRAARRPKPPSLKEQALRELGYVYADEKIDGHAYDTIKRALEALPND
jgi:hypothetical protein